jgi:hypothetical protein
MPVSVSNTVYGIIKDAMMDAGLLQEGADPNSEQLANNMRRLCDIINLWQTQGLTLFLLEEITVDLIEDQQAYTVNPAGLSPSKHLRIIQGRIHNSSGVLVRELRPLDWNEWNRLAHTSGVITGYLVDKQPTSLIVRVWNKPDATEAANNMILLVHKQVENPYNLESNVAFPQEWRIALRWGLADDISTGQPEAIMARCKDRAETFRSALEDWDVEDTPTYFVMGAQANEGGSFR